MVLPDRLRAVLRGDANASGALHTGLDILVADLGQVDDTSEIPTEVDVRCFAVDVELN